MGVWLVTRVPQRRHRVLLVAAAVAVGLLLAWSLPLLVGLPVETLLDPVIPAGASFAALAWLVAYPAILAAMEYAGRRSRAHLSEPDFEVRLPLVEPLVGVVGLLGSTAWVLTSGLAAEGLGSAVGALLAAGLLSLSCGILATALARPIASRLARDRAYAKYVEGSAASMDKNNPRRARRLLERALAIALVPERRVDIEVRHEAAVLAEAEQLRQRGLDDQADALVARLRARATAPPSPRPPPESAERSRRPTVRAASTGTVDRRANPPVRLPLDGVRLATAETPLPRDPVLRTAHDRAGALVRRDRAREAVEILVEAELPLPPEMARSAVQQYVAQGMLRSAFVLCEALGDDQIPEFYKAAAVEWARAPDPAEDRLPLGERILDALEARGEDATAARVACQAALEPDAPPELRKAMALRARRAFSRLEEPPPAELLEVTGDLEGAARRYEIERRTEDARRCLERLADQLLERRARSGQLVPILSRLFLLDPGLGDERLSSLVDHVIETNATGAQAQRILTVWRSRHPEDVRVAFRLFHLLVAAERPDDALAELTRIANRQDSQPASLVEDFRRLVATFPEHYGAREGLARMLVRAGRAREATEQLSVLLDWGLEGLERATQTRLRHLVASLREWGAIDLELERMDGVLARSLGDESGARRAFESYVRQGGRDPEVLAAARAGLEARLVRPDGRPDHEAHADLARLLLAAGLGDEAKPYLEVLRASKTHADEALILLARLQLDSESPEKALHLLAGALDGRRPADAPELFYEIARAYEVLGDGTRARRIDEAVERAHPGFADEYAAARPRVDRLDTAPVGPGAGNGAASVDRAIDETALGIANQPAPAPPSSSSVEGLGLADALAPRYRLIRRLGSGGMGEVHLAEDLALGREVAVKVLRRTLATDLFISKFRDEARIVAQLSHPGIVGVFDIGQKNDWSYIVMEYVRGPNLATLVSASVPPPRSQVVAYVATVADAMAYAHRRGVVHRDLKPANILVGVDGVVKVTDFGIARVLAGERREQTAFSAAGLQVGTVNFMAPEQLLYDTADARTDIYLLATTLYYCLCRKYPFSGEAAQALKTREDAPRLSTRISVSPQLDELVAAAIARRPEERPESMDAFAAALRTVPEASAGEDSTELVTDAP